MMTEDGTQTKNQDKERVIAAIAALKAQGSDINPYTVSGEAQVPRSTLYRDPELMDLIYRERNGDDSNQMSSDEIQSKIAELEEANEALNEQIWDLEKQLESMTKAKQDAYVQGFQAGIEEAARRLAASTGAETTGSHQAVQVESPVPEMQSVRAATDFEPPPLGVTLGEVDYQYSDPSMSSSSTAEVEAPELSPASAAASSEPPPAPSARPQAESGKQTAKPVDESTGDYEPLSDSHIAGDFHFDDSLMADSDDSYSIETKLTEPAASRAADATATADLHPVPGAADPTATADLHPVPEPASTQAQSRAAKNPEETGEHDIFDDIESLIGEQSQTPATAPAPAPAAANADAQPRKKKNFPDIDFGLSSEPETNGGEHHQEAMPTGAVQTAPRPPEPQPAAVAATAEESAVSQLTRDPEGIYNIARSGPTISSSAYNPLVELSWKDLQTVYNFSVASLKDYAKPGFGSEPGSLGGTNFADSSTQQPKSAPQPKQPVAPKHEARYMEAPDSIGQDPRRTGDRLQALSDPRNLLDSEPIVDLDALDIFDDLDDYVDLDKIEVIEDVVAKPKAEEPSMGGDELRELIKGRIKQAAEMPNEPSTPRMTTPPQQGGKDDAKGAAPAGARNKFIGGAKAGQEPPPSTPSFVVKQIPPEIRKACMILGLKPEDATQKSVIEAWKKQIASPGVHPDLGGDTEAAVYLNTAKDQLVRWLDQQAPKLGKKFGQAKPEPPRPPKKDED